MRGSFVPLALVVLVASSGCSVKSELMLQDQVEIASLKREIGLSKAEIAALQESNAIAEGRVAELEGELSTLKSLASNRSMTFEVGVDADGNDTGVLRIPDMLLFPPGSARLSSEGLGLLEEIGAELSLTKGFVVRVEGHADSTPMKDGVVCLPSNWDLSAKRALGVVHRLLASFDLDPSMIEAVGCGEYRPVASNATPEGRRVNRRVEIHLTRPPSFAYLRR